jgi:hypothetical protein
MTTKHYTTEELQLAMSYMDTYLAYRRALLGLGPIADLPTRWEAAIEARTRRGMLRYQAIADIEKTDPALWQAYSDR